MGEVLAFHGADDRGGVDALSVAVSAVLWRFGGRGTLKQVAPLVALADDRLRCGRSDVLLRILIEEVLLQRKRDGLAPILYVGPEYEEIGLTDLALGILGPCPRGVGRADR